MKHAARRRRPWLAYSASAVLLFAGTFGVSLASFASGHAERGLPTVYLGDRSFSGLSASDISTRLAHEVASETVTVDVEGRKLTVPFSETGVRLDAPATAADLVAPASSTVGALRTLLAPVHVSPTYSVDEAAFAEFVDRVNELTGNAPKSATAQVDESGEKFVVTPAAAGRGVDESVVRASLVESLASAGSVALSLTASDREPRVSTQAAQEVADQANKFVSTEFAIVTPKEKVVPTAKDKASWVEVVLEANGKPSLHQKPDEVTQWAKKVVEAANRQPINGIIHVDAAGNELEIGRPAKAGTQITNEDAALSHFTEGVSAAEPTSVTLSSVEIPAGMDNVVKPAGRERFAYQPRGKEKWVEVNLTYSTLTAYEGYTPVYGPILINHGGEGHETVTGTYHVYLKYDKQDMGCTPEWEYCEKDVPSVSYWHQSYALHGAPWVKEFGIGTDETSHGCINIPPKDAEWIHGFTEIGTTVVTHY